MRYIIYFFLLISTTTFSQDIEEMLNKRKFILQASKITDNEGNVTTTSRKFCFILVDTSRIVVQWTASSDNNGLGGITIHGRIIDYEFSASSIEKEIRHLLKLKCEMDEGRVKSEIMIEIFNKSHAEASLTNQTPSIFVPEMMKFLGKLIPLVYSAVLIGAD
jgi:hypothetical protein